ncbi:hypothetical protein ACJ73_02010 [Blastomyces percursus]|uniref:Rhodopsin domain-containing protein n=1 Tax=Blastomyces percursus TaxID=1658174 RepID=A0A1J9QDK2_9EURO|nr:hypothetical protein ACJ73_02010 [Blastomyces percursus]
MDDRGPPPPDGDVNKGPMLNAITWTECSVALVLVMARVITRTRLIQRWGWDDAFMCLAMACALVNTICVTICIHYGTGRHVYYLNEHQKVQANKFNWISQGFHVMSTNWGKVSIGFFLLRIVDRAKRQKYVFFGGMVLLTIVNSVCVYTIYGQCTPTTALWNGTGPGKKGSCWHPNLQRDYAFFQGSFSAASDLALALYPVFIIWRLQMARKLKIGLTCVLALGIVATAAAIVKTIFLAELVARADYTFETINLTTWISTEQYVIIIAACIPTLGPLFTATTGRTPSGRRAGSSPGYRPSGSNSRRYFHQGASVADGSGHAFKKRKGSDLLTYTMDEFATTTMADGWARTSPPNGRRSDDGSEEAIIKSAADEVSRGDRGGSGERNHSSSGILKTMEVEVNSQDMERDTQRRTPAKNKVLLPWEPTSPT